MWINSAFDSLDFSERIHNLTLRTSAFRIFNRFKVENSSLKVGDGASYRVFPKLMAAMSENAQLIWLP